uniref:ATP synthase protein MI25 n=1 Tax=Trebouxia lynnae TaxID=1825957 RepID=A0A5J6DTR6_9CHLO|nr:ATP synthase F0 subunit beta [Trebouxia lynnae]
MISNHKIRPYIFGFLVFCVFTSKNIIIYNEETLVALSFFAFIFFVFRYFGDTIKQSLDERSQTIKYELQNFLYLKADSLKQLYKEHQKVAALTSTLSTVKQFTVSELKQSTKYGKTTLNKVFSDQIKQKLNTLSSSKVSLYQEVQQLIAQNILSAVLVKISSLKKAGKKDFLLNSKNIKTTVKKNALHFLGKPK